MKFYVLKPGLQSAYIPGIGTLVAGSRPIAGDYDKYVPTLLREVAPPRATRALTEDVRSSGDSMPVPQHVLKKVAEKAAKDKATKEKDKEPTAEG